MLFANAPLYQGPLIGLIGNGDISIYVGFVVAAVAYYLLMRGTIRTQMQALLAATVQADPAPVPVSVPETEGMGQ